MTLRSTEDSWAELRRLVNADGKSKPKQRDIWTEMFGADDGEGLFYDAEGNDRTDLFRALVERLDETSKLAMSLSERVIVLERLAVQDEARIALEIEKLRGSGS